ncbi:cytochrome P450 71A1-like [Dioscorea cayenensis subsp. rotundata]|uniref:Cytochrome P450 71A1-like n=1 Tax=Dioscorea cayennensis subsp. rotundata TaxID=55577 RepID=A0AB40CGP6_DIOCR|nr:cytochrome P450 71A1-like [Dioscorea cayenensis subsp. rotundata]
MALELLIPISLILVLLLLSIKLALFPTKTSDKLPPCPRKLPFIGNLHQIGLLPHQSLHKLSKKHGPLMLLQLGQVPTLVVSSSQMAKEILKTHDLIFASRPKVNVADIMLYGSQNMAFSPYGEHWRQMRKIAVTNLLSMKRVQSLHGTMEEQVAHMLSKISDASSSVSPINLSKILFSFTNGMLFRAILGRSFDEEDENKMKFHEMMEETAVLLGGFNVEDYFPSLGWLCSLFGLDDRAKRTSSKWDCVLDQMIEDHVNMNKKGEGEDDDFVDVLLSIQGDPNKEFFLSKDHMKALLLDMLFGGTETGYVTLEWSLAELIRNPKVMKKLQDEVRGKAFGKSMVKQNDLSDMNYLKAFLKEILRLHPPAPLLVPRESMESCRIQGYDIPKKTRVIVNYWAITRDQKIWDSPEELRPERFENNPIDFKGQHNYEYIPFGAGRRMCPAVHYGVTITELALANLVHRFDWKLPDGMVIEDFDMTETHALTVKMKSNLLLVAKPYF